MHKTSYHVETSQWFYLSCRDKPALCHSLLSCHSNRVQANLKRTILIASNLQVQQFQRTLQNSTTNNVSIANVKNPDENYHP